MVRVAPSMLSADFLHLEKDVAMVDAYGDMFHLDIMDGVFVPNLSYGFPVAKAIISMATKPVDTHLMIINPEKYVARFAEIGTNMLSFHLDATQNPSDVLKLIHDHSLKAGIAINPNIPVESLYPYLEECDFVLIMSVFAGFGGQKFIPEAYSRIETVKNEIVKKGLDCLVEVDGGVSPENAGKLAAVGADILVAGSSVFKADDPAAAIRKMREA